MWMAALARWWVGLQSLLLFSMLAMMNQAQILLLLPPLGEGWDGGTRDAGTVSALAPTLTLPRKGREFLALPRRKGRQTYNTPPAQ